MCNFCVFGTAAHVEFQMENYNEGTFVRVQFYKSKHALSTDNSPHFATTFKTASELERDELSTCI